MENIKLDRTFINKLSEEIKNKEGVIDVDTSDISYDEDNKLHYYNNIIRVIFENTSFYGFKLEKFNLMKLFLVFISKDIGEAFIITSITKSRYG
jgi:hypothetical protein